MNGRPLAVVTGAFSYTGAAVARSLSARGWALRTLTNRSIPLQRLDFDVEAHPLQFEDAGRLVAALEGARALVNTYWIRYPHAGLSFDVAVANSGRLFEAARAAGVERVVHVSVSNAAPDSTLDYYRGKAAVEALVRGCGLSHAIVRPTLVVDEADILVNNIAWFLRRFPIFAMPGDGRYRVQPVTLEDTGEIVAEAVCAEGGGGVVLDAAGPEVLTFEELVRAVGRAVGCRAGIVHLPPELSLGLIRAVGWVVGETILARQELEGLMQELLVSAEPPRGRTGFSDWLARHGEGLGRRYQSELRRHFAIRSRA
jgi:NADH dehydrogenase